MPARRGKKSASKMTAQAAPDGLTEDSEKLPEETRASVTQVVEVVEEDIPVASAEKNPDPPDMVEPVNEENIAQQQTEEPPREAPKESATTTTTSRKSMVEELYSNDKKSNVMPEISMHRNGSRKPLMVWAIVTIIVALLTGGILFAVSRNGTAMPALFVRPTPTPTPTIAPTPTPTPAEVDKSSFEIEVLNGGGTPGAAGKMKTVLEELGYTVSDTGNTEEYTYESTEIHGKSTMADAVANLKTDLKDSYTLGTVDTDLDASASSDIQVIVGKE